MIGHRVAARHKVGVVLVVGMSMLAGACTGGRDPAPEPAGTAATPKTLFVIGSSPTLGRGLEHPTRDSWPQLVLDQAFRPGDVLYNLAMPGGYTSEARAGFDEALGAATPDVVAIWIGGRDDLEDTPIEQFRADLEALATAAGAEGADVVMATLLDGHPSDDRDPAYNEAIRSVAAAADASLVDLAVVDVARIPGDDEAFLPNEAGHRTIANEFIAAIGATGPGTAEIAP